LGSVSRAVTNGRETAQAYTTLRQVQEMEKAFDYFFQDRDRYPSADEANNPRLMLTYLNRLPEEAEYSSSKCPQKLSYRPGNLMGYELYFCLPRAVSGYNVGWNKVQKAF
jgi:hypothetical protein